MGFKKFCTFLVNLIFPCLFRTPPKGQISGMDFKDKPTKVNVGTIGPSNRLRRSQKFGGFSNRSKKQTSAKSENWRVLGGGSKTDFGKVRKSKALPAARKNRPISTFAFWAGLQNRLILTLGFLVRHKNRPILTLGFWHPPKQTLLEFAVSPKVWWPSKTDPVRLWHY